jgi:hypothetical protein
LLPLVPPERHRDLHLIATAIAIAAREASARDGPTRDILDGLTKLYGATKKSLSALQGGEGDPTVRLLRRFALDLRNGAFETCPSQESAARAILWRLAIARLREANPQFLAANGFD